MPRIPLEIIIIIAVFPVLSGLSQGSISPNIPVNQHIKLRKGKNKSSV